MLQDATLTIGMQAIANAITHVQMHSAAPGAGFATAAVGARIPVTPAVDGDGDMTITATFPDGHFTGGATFVAASYWSALTGGTNRGGVTSLTGDTAANAAGAYTLTATENMAST